MTHRFPFRHCSRLVLVATIAVVQAASMGHCEDGAMSPAAPTLYDGQVTPTACRHCGSSRCECELICCPEKVTETEKKSFWKVTCEYVCIPGFRFPWECKKNVCGCECLVCGRVRAVNVLEEEEYECEICGYKWEVKCVRRSGESGSAGCNCPRCAEREQARLAAEKEAVRKL